MARRRRKSRGRSRKQKAIPLGPLVAPVYITARELKFWGLNESGLAGMSRYLIGFDPVQGDWQFDRIKPVLFGVIAGTVAHKIANKVGINRQIKKFTLGYLQI